MEGPQKSKRVKIIILLLPERWHFVNILRVDAVTLCGGGHKGVIHRLPASDVTLKFSFTQDFKEHPYFNAKSLEVDRNSCLMISLSRGMGEVKDPSYFRSHFKSKLPGSPGGKRQIRHPIPPPEFLFMWL